MEVKKKRISLTWHWKEASTKKGKNFNFYGRIGAHNYIGEKINENESRDGFLISPSRKNKTKKNMAWLFFQNHLVSHPQLPSSQK